MDEKELISQEVRKYEALESLTNQEGWKILLTQLEGLKQSDILDLLKEKEHTKMLVIQARVLAYTSVINILSSAKSIKEALFDRITSILEDEQLKREFDI